MWSKDDEGIKVSGVHFKPVRAPLPTIPTVRETFMPPEVAKKKCREFIDRLSGKVAVEVSYEQLEREAIQWESLQKMNG